MATLFLSETSPGAPVLSGTNGALNAVLDWALVQNGWTIEYTATNARVYRAGTGNRFCLSVQHDSAISGNACLATVRGCESATSATTLVNPFPLVSQVPNTTATWVTSDLPSTAARKYFIYVGETWFKLMVRHGSLEYWETQFFGDAPKIKGEDSWATICTVRGVTNNSYNGGIMNTVVYPSPNVATPLFFARSIDGTIKSTRGYVSSSTSGAVPGGTPVFPSARSGYGNTIDREQAGIGCSGGTTAVLTPLCIHRRACMPNTWLPLHSSVSGMTSGDTHTDTAYNASAVFRIIPTYNAGFHITEETDTWVAP